MGAAGDAFLCGRGHLIGWINDHAYWDDEMWEEYAKLSASICPCGSACRFRLAHYGSIDDCLPDGVLPLRTLPAETFGDKSYERYDVAELFGTSADKKSVVVP